MITIPTHVQNKLNEHSSIAPENMPFKLLNTSEQNIYLWFIDAKLGFLVEENNWTESHMAEASKFDINKQLPYTEIQLKLLNIKDVKIYKDFSMSWYVKDELNTCSKTETAKHLTDWKQQLLQKSNKWLSQLTGKSSTYLKVASILDTLIQKINGLENK